MIKRINNIISDKTANDKIAHFSFDEKDDSIMLNDSNGLDKYDFINAKEISEFLGIGLTKAYEICKKINARLETQGFLTFRGKVPRKAFLEELPH